MMKSFGLGKHRTTGIASHLAFRHQQNSPEDLFLLNVDRWFVRTRIFTYNNQYDMLAQKGVIKTSSCRDCELQL